MQRLRRSPGRVSWAGVAVAAVVLLLPSRTPLAAQDKLARVQVAFLYNFTRYITWPEPAESSPQFVIGVLGDDGLGRILDRLSARQVRGRAIVIRRFASLDELESCHILFVGGSNAVAVQMQAIEATRNRPVLLVGNAAGYAEAGSPVNFYVTSRRTLGIELNIDAVQRRNLKVDAKLLKLARIVRDVPAARSATPGG